MTPRRRDPNEGIDVNELVETTHEVEHLRELIATGYAHRYPNARPGERRWGLSAAQRLPRMLEEQRRAMEAQGVRVVDDPDELERLRKSYRFHGAEDGPDERDDGLVLIAGVLYDAETLEEAEDDEPEYDADAAYERYLEDGGPNAMAIAAEDDHERELEAMDAGLQAMRARSGRA